MEKNSLGWLPPASSAGPLGGTALVAWLSHSALRAETCRHEADQTRFASKSTRRPSLFRSVRVTVGHALIAAGEAIAGCHHALDRRAVRPAR
jgi:hypothetical protein